MSISLASLSKLAGLGLSTEQMEGVVAVLAEELAPLETRRLADKERKFRRRHEGPSAERPQTQVRRTSADESSRVEDNNLLSSNIPTVSKEEPPLSPKPSKTLPSSEPDGFSELWITYPKRDGSADRKGALKAYGPALRRASRETILEGAKHFAAAMAERGEIGTRFVPQLRTWLNGDRWNERYGTPPTAAKPANSKASGFALINGALDERIRQLEAAEGLDGTGGEDAGGLPRLRQIAS